MSFTGLWQQLADAAIAVGDALSTVLSFPLTTGNRLHVAYLAVSIALAVFVFLRLRKQGHFSGSLLGFLLPASVWRSRSAWLDIRYFFVDQTLSLLTYGATTAALAGATFHIVYPWLTTWTGEVAVDFGVHPLITGTVFMLFTIAVVDFGAFVVHVLQHKVPLLWEFHKVHHSATVMHPLTAFRAHPVDKIAAFVVRGVSLGIITGSALALLGHVPTAPTLFGIGASALIYDLLGRNLRHSHIWLRWPDKFNYVISAPAHHQLHHSSHSDHRDKNYAVMFPVWDVVFGSYVHPRPYQQVNFGLGTDEETEYKSVLGLYCLPFQKAWRRFKSARSTTTPAPVATDSVPPASDVPRPVAHQLKPV